LIILKIILNIFILIFNIVNLDKKKVIVIGNIAITLHKINCFL